MRTKNKEAQIYLTQVEKLDVLIQCKMAEREQWHELALSITSCMGGERVQVSGSQSKMADAVAKCIDMEDEISGQVDKLIAAKKEVTQTLERLENPTWYKLLHLRYIQHYSLSEVADIFNSSYDWAKTTHGRALKAVQEILGGK